MAEQQFIGVDPSALCSLLPTRLLMTGLFRDLLTKHFADPASIEEDDLKHLIWGENVFDTEIMIETVYRWRPEATEFRPAILIHGNTISRMQRGIGDRNLGNSVTLDGAEHFSTFYVGSHTLFCIAGSAAQAELLAEEVQREIVQFAPVILEYFHHIKRIGATQIGAVAQIEESDERFVAPVTIGYCYEQKWKVKMQAPRLNISLSLLTSC